MRRNPDLREGDRIRLILMANDEDPVPPGVIGEVLFVTSHQVFVKWEGGRTDHLHKDFDVYEVIK